MIRGLLTIERWWQFSFCEIGAVFGFGRWNTWKFLHDFDVKFCKYHCGFNVWWSFLFITGVCFCLRWIIVGICENQKWDRVNTVWCLDSSIFMKLVHMTFEKSKTTQTYQFYDFLSVNCHIGIYVTKPFKRAIISVNKSNGAVFDVIVAVVVDKVISSQR